MKNLIKFLEPEISIPKNLVTRLKVAVNKFTFLFVIMMLVTVSIATFINYYSNGLAIAYNDARSHLDIGRRVVEGLKPGLAQLGSVWLPLPHVLMIPTIWSDFMWHTGLSGALISMVSFVVTGVVIYLFLKELNASVMARFFGVLVYVCNINILYLTSTAMTELLLLATMMLGCYFLLIWAKKEDILSLIKASFFVMLSTLVRYDGWFLLFFGAVVVSYLSFRRKGIKAAEGYFVLFCTLGGFGVFLWLLWNLAIFKDPFYFAFGPFSAHAQQAQLETAGDLPTKGDLFLSVKIYLYALMYNAYTLPAILSVLGIFALLKDKLSSHAVKVASMALLAPLLFNIIALYLGHSVLFIQGISGNTWFNVRYGVTLIPSIAVFLGLLVDRIKSFRWIAVGLWMIVTVFAFLNNDAVTIDDATVGSSQKNVSEVSGWLSQNAKDNEGFILISAASHDAIIFSSGLPMSKFIHEGTGAYWESATESPDRWARWMVMRTHDQNDLVFREIHDEIGYERYDLVESYPFADIYQLRDEYLPELITTPVFGRQK
jgi:hypothetical protein